MSDLIEFLNARLDEDEGYLKSNQRHLWTQRPFREVAAKRRIVNELAAEADNLDLANDGEMGIHDRNLAVDPMLGQDLLRTLAAVFSDHPDYREEWAVVPSSTRTCAAAQQA